MPLPLPRYKMIAAVESDRDRSAAVGSAKARVLVTIARQRAYRTWRSGTDLAEVVDTVRRSMESVRPLMVDAMVNAHLRGHKRSGDNVRHFTDGGIKLSTAYDGAIEFLSNRLSLTDAQVQSIRATYEAKATEITVDGADKLVRSVEDAITEGVRAGNGIKDGTRALTQAFENSGFSIDNPYEIETMFRTSTQMAYGSGRWNALQDPALADLLWGYEFAAILDDRTTEEICRPLNGMVRPAGDEVWQRLTPPNHYNCRSTVLELFDAGTPTAVPPVQAQPGFGVNFGRLFSDRRAA